MRQVIGSVVTRGALSKVYYREKEETSSSGEEVVRSAKKTKRNEYGRGWHGRRTAGAGFGHVMHGLWKYLR